MPAGHARHPQPARRGRATRLALRALPATAFWALLTGGDPASWVIGVPTVVVAVAAADALGEATPWRVSLTGLLAFLPFFAWHALTGSVDVARRALLPGLPIDPSFERYRLRLPAAGPSRVVFVNTVSLLPGTLSADLDGEDLTVHALSGGHRTGERLRALEGRVAALFGGSLVETP